MSGAIARRLKALELGAARRQSFCLVFEHDSSTDLYSNVDFPGGVTSAELDRLISALPPSAEPKIIIIPCNGR